MATPPWISSRGIAETLRWTSCLAGLAVLAWLPRTSALFFALCAGTPVEHYQADLDQDGYVSLVEASYACNLDSRPVHDRGRVCTEYYNRVDWRPVTLVCD